MKIANPIYDAVFKFMMDDQKVAKLLLSAIIGEEIIELSVQTTEIPMPISASVTVFRMDFKAIIQQKDGLKKVVTIEIQKAKLATDIMRFRRYLGQQYIDKNNSILLEIKKNKKGEEIEYRQPLPILSIYFLGHGLEHLKNIPVIKVNRIYWDVGLNQEIKAKEEFVESLTHDSIIIQIPYITGHQRTELEQLLQIFDQSQSEKKEPNSIYNHLVNVQEQVIPEQYQAVLRRLLEAFASTEIREMMYAEDEVLNEMRMHAREVEYLKEEIEDKKQEIAQQKKTILKTVNNLIAKGFTDQEIADLTELPIEQVRLLRP